MKYAEQRTPQKQNLRSVVSRGCGKGGKGEKLLNWIQDFLLKR